MKQKTLHCALEIVGKICSFTKSPSGFVFICAFAEQDVPLPRCIDRWRRCFAISTFHSFLMRMTKIGYHFGPQRMVKQKKTGIFAVMFCCVSAFICLYFCFHLDYSVISSPAAEFSPTNGRYSRSWPGLYFTEESPISWWCSFRYNETQFMHSF